MSSARGVAVAGAIALDFQLRNHIVQSDSEIDIYEFAILQAVQDERSRWETERIKSREG